MNSILGQSQALEILTTALRSGRFHHAWIFSGPRGVGKFTTALEIARFLLEQFTAEYAEHAENKKKQSPSALSASSVVNPDGFARHPDLHIIHKELALFSDNPQLRERKLLTIPLDLLREKIIGGKTGDDRIHEAAAYRTPFKGHGKVFIIDEAELLARDAQNAMLKTLEEPPPQTYFFLITSQPDRLLSTIRSRCQHVRFNRLDPQSMKQWLASHSALSTQHSALLTWIEQFADGSPGIAQLTIEYGFFDWHKTLEPMLNDLERGNFPVTMGDTMAGLVEEFALAWVKAHKNASKDAANKDGVRHLFSMLAWRLRNKLVTNLERGHDASASIAAIDLLRQAERELESNVNLKLLLENLVVQWSPSGVGSAS